MNDDQDFTTWFDSLPDAEQIEVLARLRSMAAAAGVTVTRADTPAMSPNLRELANQAIEAIHEGDELPDDYFDKLSRLAPEEKNEVAQAIHDYAVEQQRRDRVAAELLEGLDL